MRKAALRANPILSVPLDPPRPLTKSGEG